MLKIGGHWAEQTFLESKKFLDPVRPLEPLDKSFWESKIEIEETNVW